MAYLIGLSLDKHLKAMTTLQRVLGRQTIPTTTKMISGR